MRMPELYQVRIESVRDKCLTCRVSELYGNDYDLVNSRTLALGFLWDTTEWFRWWEILPDVAQTQEEIEELVGAFPLSRDLAHHEFGKDWSLANAGRFVSCVGVIDRGVGRVVGFDEKIPQATYLISVTEPRWIEHLVTGMEWNSRVWDHDQRVECEPAWRTSDVMSLAKSIDKSQDFSGMPILADALQDAGCDSGDLLNHLRDANAAHVRGCWALDLILGKE